MFYLLLFLIFLWRRINIAKKQNDKRIIKVGTADDHKDHILVYLFATLLPFYSVGIESLRDIGTTLVALIFVIFLFLHLNLHYMNILFAMKGYRILQFVRWRIITLSVVKYLRYSLQKEP